MTVSDSGVKLVNIICTASFEPKYLLRILVYKIAVSPIEFSSYNKIVMATCA